MGAAQRYSIEACSIMVRMRPRRLLTSDVAVLGTGLRTSTATCSMPLAHHCLLHNLVQILHKLKKVQRRSECSNPCCNHMPGTSYDCIHGSMLAYRPAYRSRRAGQHTFKVAVRRRKQASPRDTAKNFSQNCTAHEFSDIHDIYCAQASQLPLGPPPAAVAYCGRCRRWQ